MGFENQRQIRLFEYLDNQVKAGKNFFKYKFIVRETGMSSKEVGTNMGSLLKPAPGSQSRNTATQTAPPG